MITPLPLPNQSPVAYLEECMNNAVSKRIDGQLRYAQEVLPGKRTAVTFVQAGEPAVEAFNLAGQD